MTRLRALAAALTGLVAAMALMTPAHADSGGFLIINDYSGKCLELMNSDLHIAAPIDQYQCHGGLNQRWTLDDHTGQLRNAYSGQCATFLFTTADGAQLRQYPCATSDVAYGDFQRWFHSYDGRLVNLDTHKCAIDFGFSTADFGEVGQWECASTYDQRWTFF